MSCAALGSASATVFTVGREGFTETIAVRLTARTKALSGGALGSASTLDAALTAVEVIRAKYKFVRTASAFLAAPAARSFVTQLV